MGKVSTTNIAGFLMSHIKPEPCVGTGRFLLEATILNPKASMVLFGIEIDPWMYRACLVNLAMFSNHPYSIICADTLMLAPDKCDPGGKVWDYGNQWLQPDITPFYCKIEPPFKFSLADLAKERRNQPVITQREVQEITMPSPLQAYMKMREKPKSP